MINWRKAETTLFELASDDLRAFAAAHPDEIFYGFFLDCNSFYGDVLLHLNTATLLHQRVKESKKNHPDLYKGIAVAQLEKERRWDAGSWGYFEINRPDSWREGWAPTAAAINQLPDADKGKEFEERFMEMACRVLIRLESANLFDLFQQTDDFAIHCADHDERIDQAAKRLDAVRKKLARS